MNPLSDQKIVASWHNNVMPWIEAIQNGDIKSRVEITNQAILTSVMACTPKKVLDIGCGEGWLVRELTKSGVDTLGTDAVPQLIDYAIKEGNGRYNVVPYEKLSYEALGEKFDVVVSNFSFLGKESVNRIFKQIPSILNKGGSFIVQTIHPITGCGAGKYKDGWREGSWNGFNEKFSDPAPWYFRTLDSWKALFQKNGFIIKNMKEPIDLLTNKAASVVFIGILNN